MSGKHYNGIKTPMAMSKLYIDVTIARRTLRGELLKSAGFLKLDMQTDERRVEPLFASAVEWDFEILLPKRAVTEVDGSSSFNAVLSGSSRTYFSVGRWWYYRNVYGACKIPRQWIKTSNWQ